MADASDTNSAPKSGRKTSTRTSAQTRAGGRKAASAKSAAMATPKGGDFGESVELARAAAKSAASVARAKVKGAADTAKAAAGTAKTKVKDTTRSKTADWKSQADQMRTQATHAAREAADTAKAKTGSAMQGLAKLITDTAETVDARLGPQYGDYARQAANAVAGAAKTLDEKDIDQLLGEARDFVRKSPAVAIGAAAVAGYVLMRLAKGSSDEA